MSVTVFAESLQVRVPEEARAFDGFLKWSDSADAPDVGIVHLLRGDLWFDMNGDALNKHARIRSAIQKTLHQLRRLMNHCLVLSLETRWVHPKLETVTYPDGMFISFERHEDCGATFNFDPLAGRGQVTGSPDIVFEVVSRSSVKKDTETLFEAYYEAGIPEYWLVDACRDELRFDIYKRGPKRYVATRKLGGWQKSVVLGKSFKLVRADDADGNPEFTLQVK